MTDLRDREDRAPERRRAGRQRAFNVISDAECAELQIWFERRAIAFQEAWCDPAHSSAYDAATVAFEHYALHIAARLAGEGEEPQVAWLLCPCGCQQLHPQLGGRCLTAWAAGYILSWSRDEPDRPDVDAQRDPP